MRLRLKGIVEWTFEGEQNGLINPSMQDGVKTLRNKKLAYVSTIKADAISVKPGGTAGIINPVPADYCYYGDGIFYLSLSQQTVNQ